MILDKITQLLTQRRCTLLGVGPVSKNVVDAAIELSNDYDVPLFLIASRRQIDAAEFGGGYVNNWTTEEFARYVQENDKRGEIILARDHGGPWQNTFEVEGKFSLHKAMESAKRSFEADIRSGFHAIHIDPSIDIWGKPSVDEVLLRTFELYEHCWSVAEHENQKIIFEIGTEEQSGDIGSLEDVQYSLEKLRAFCQKNNIPFPTFIVIQTGTKVLETKNIGSLSTPYRVAYEIPAEIQIPRMIDMCNKNGIYLKQHNSDYLPDDTLFLFPKLGIHSVNVAPEFGVTETRAFLNILEECNLKQLRDDFETLAYESRKWEKWMEKDTKATDLDKAVIAGHYVFGRPEFAEIKEKAVKQINGKIPSLDHYLKEEIKKSIMRYVKNFRLLRIV